MTWMRVGVLELEIYPDCGKEIGIEAVVSVSTQECGFAYS